MTFAESSEGIALMRPLAYVQLACAVVAAEWIVQRPISDLDKRGMVVLALVGAVSAASLLAAPVRILSRFWMPIALGSLALLAGYTFFGGGGESLFAGLTFVAAAAAVWFLSRLWAGVLIGWMLGTHLLALWFSHSRGEAAWPQISGHDVGSMLIGVGALASVALVTEIVKRRVIDGERRLAALVEASQDAILWGNRDGVITAWSRGAERMFGYTRSEAVGQRVGLMYPPGYEGRDAPLMRRVMAGELIEDHVTERMHKDGSLVIVSLSISPIHGPGGAVVGALSVTRDVTSQKRARERLSLQAELLGEVDAAVIFDDMEGVVRYWSHGAERLFGYTAEEAVGRELVGMMMPAQSRAEMLRLQPEARDGRPVEGELDVCDKQGRVIPVYFRVRPFSGVDVSGAGAGNIIVAVDMRSHREADATIRRSAEGQEEIAKLGRLALRGASLEDLLDRAVGAACRILSADCADLAECLPDAAGFVIRAAVGWPGERTGQQIAGGEHSGPAYVLSSGEPLVVEDWSHERRCVPTSKMLKRGVRSSVAVLVGDRDSPFAVLGVHYERPGAVPSDCRPFLDALATVVADAIRSRDVQEQIRHRALHDELTGLPNRTLFLDRVAHALTPDDRYGRTLAVLMLDIDHFKLVNDSLGHEAGDELLRLVAARLESVIRPRDTLARLGGDEFALLCEQLPSEVAATRIASQLTGALEKPIVLDGHGEMVSASIGIAIGNDEHSAAELLRDADAAMYQAKTAGRGRAEMFDQAIRTRLLGRIAVEAALRAALEDEDRIYVEYQPLVCPLTGQIVGAEALARWRHPDWGPVSPVEFIPVAEETGLIHQLGAQVMRRAARESAAWQGQEGFAGIAVNVSTMQLVEHDEVAMLAEEVIAAQGLAPGFLTLEITESALIEQIGHARSALRSLADLGVGLSLDDFGTGYSSLSYLQELPFDSLKIDRSLIRNIVEQPQAYAFVATIIQMGHVLGTEVIAEGIETVEQATRLQALNCDVAQGYYFARPMGPEMFTALLLNPPRWFAPRAKSPATLSPAKLSARTAARPVSKSRKRRPTLPAS